MNPSPSARRRAAQRRALALFSVAAVSGSLLAAAPAVASPEPLVVRGAGLSAPTGAVQTPDGARWVADALRGVCRIAEDGGHVVEDRFCSDPHTGAAHDGPISTAGLAFDKQTSSFYAGDGQSNSGAVWRLHWNAETGAIDTATEIVDAGADRVTGVALAAGAYGEPAFLLYTTKRSAAVMAVADPAGHAPVAVPAGFARAASPNGVAVLGEHVYLAEGNAITRFPLASGSGRLATIVPGTEGIASTALAADHETGRVYAGTSYPGLADDVVAVHPASGAVETYERGFAGVTGLGVETDGDLLVADDPGVAAGNIDSLDQARLFGVRHRELGLGRVTITAAPAAWSAASSVTFAYTSSRAHARFECRVDGGEWMECDGYGSGSITLEGLEEGTHSFEVRTTTGAGTGTVARRIFVLDRTAPVVRITAPLDGAEIVRGRGRLELVASEAWVAFTCTIDGGEPMPCEPGQPLPALEPGEHVLRVVGRDGAGNLSEEATAAFTVVLPPPAPEPKPEPPVAEPPAIEPPVAQPPAPVPAAPSTPAGETPLAFVPRGEVAGVADASAPRLRFLRLRTARLPRGARVIRLALGADATARTARVTVRSAAGVVVLRRDVAVRPELVLKLTRAERSRLLPGRHVVSVRLAGAGGTTSNVRSAVLRIADR